MYIIDKRQAYMDTYCVVYVYRHFVFLHGMHVHVGKKCCTLSIWVFKDMYIYYIN